ncbi:MAG: hypothetical protein KJ888_20445 [Gammaproteobacteria bacterium]|uniref:Uncharacterized protein n=1 Tax=viral metagenome TaxID=1070528 RepID=A0A6M3ITP6_9ZZZZ|nr:hypothetical protein [Gammaproteobacteria bacterium]
MGKWLGQSKNCDICQEDLHPFTNKHWFVDGKTSIGSGPWALMCARCFEIYGTGLGTGKGQKYDADTMEKIEG